MQQQVDLDLSKRVGVVFGPYDDHALYLIQGLRTGAGVSRVGYRCAETAASLLAATRSSGAGIPLYTAL